MTKPTDPSRRLTDDEIRARSNPQKRRTGRLLFAWPGEITASGAVELHELKIDGHDVEMTESRMRENADYLRAARPRDVRVNSVEVDKTSPERPFPFTHVMMILADEWQGPRDWLVTVDDSHDPGEPRGNQA